LSRPFWRSFFADRGDQEAFDLLSLRPVRVKKIISSTTEMTYDVTISHGGAPRFVVDGVLTHNSFKRSWTAQVAGVENAYRTPVTQSEGIEWIDLQHSSQEMGYQGWLEYNIKIACACFLIDPSEVNFDLHGGVQQTPLFESSQEWKLKASRDKGLRPLLKFVAGLVNEHIISKIDDHFIFSFDGLDELTEQEKHELIKEQIASYKTLNEARRELDLPEVEGEFGDIPLNPTLIQFVQMQQQREDQQKEREQAEKEQQQQEQAQQGQEQPQVEDPVKEQKMRHDEDKHPLEVELLKQKLGQGQVQQQMMQAPVQESEQTAAEPAKEAAPEQAAPEQAVQRPKVPKRKKGDHKTGYSALFGKSVTFDDFVDFMRSQQK